MKTFLVENTRKNTKIKVVLHNPPYENENILYKTGYKEIDCKISEIHSAWDEELGDISLVDNIPDVEDNDE